MLFSIVSGAATGSGSPVLRAARSAGFGGQLPAAIVMYLSNPSNTPRLVGLSGTLLGVVGALAGVALAPVDEFELLELAAEVAVALLAVGDATGCAVETRIVVQALVRK